MKGKWFDVFLKVFIPLLFLASGIIILALRIPGWSLIFGLPATAFGLTFLIYTYDEIVSGNIYHPEEDRICLCSICRRPTLCLPGQEGRKDIICSDCRKKLLAGEIKKKSL